MSGCRKNKVRIRKKNSHEVEVGENKKSPNVGRVEKGALNEQGVYRQL